MNQVDKKESAEKIGRGILVEHMQPHVVHGNRIQSREYVRNSVLIATPQMSKEVDLPSGSTNLQQNEFPEAEIVSGGQDSAGCATFDGGAIQAILVAADGCSFADRKQAAQAAKFAVAEVLSAGKAIAYGQLGNHPIEMGLTAGISLANKEILTKFPDGATTIAAAAIVIEPRTDGAQRILCYVSSCGDASINILGTRKDGTAFMRRLNGHADTLERMAVGRDKDFFDKTPIERKEIREIIIKEFMKNMNILRQEAEDMLISSGITACLGEKGKRFSPEMQKFEISSLFAEGVTNIKILACSDNAGDKIPSNEIIQLYLRSKNNRVFSEALLKLMMARDQDDGCCAIMDVGRVKI